MSTSNFLKGDWLRACHSASTKDNQPRMLYSSFRYPISRKGEWAMHGSAGLVPGFGHRSFHGSSSRIVQEKFVRYAHFPKQKKTILMSAIPEASESAGGETSGIEPDSSSVPTSSSSLGSPQRNADRSLKLRPKPMVQPTQNADQDPLKQENKYTKTWSNERRNGNGNQNIGTWKKPQTTNESTGNGSATKPVDSENSISSGLLGVLQRATELSRGEIREEKGNEESSVPEPLFSASESGPEIELKTTEVETPKKENPLRRPPLPVPPKEPKLRGPPTLKVAGPPVRRPTPPPVRPPQLPLGHRNSPEIGKPGLEGGRVGVGGKTAGEREERPRTFTPGQRTQGERRPSVGEAGGVKRVDRGDRPGYRPNNRGVGPRPPGSYSPSIGGKGNVGEGGIRRPVVGKRPGDPAVDVAKSLAEKDKTAPKSPENAGKPATVDDRKRGKDKGKWKGKGKGEEQGDDLELKGSVSKRRQSRISRKLARQELAKANAPVRVEILEVGPQGLTVGELAVQLAINDSEVVKCLFLKGMATTVNQRLDLDAIQLVCGEYEVEVLEQEAEKVENMASGRKEFLEEEDLDNLQVRPPVVTIMGHVDHGKTSLLDFIRKSKVAASEAGGITQGIGAYRVRVPHAEKEEGEEDPICVFLDTPGHEAFSAMRARGALVTDIVILVVAADDGVRPQTEEAVAHARAAKVPVVVAINKVDKEGANPDRVIEQLAALNLVPEVWGGDTPMVPVSALTGQGVDELLETVMLVSMVQDLRANPERDSVGTVIEASLDKFRGPVATLLVQNGTLKKGDVVLCGEAFGKVRALSDDRGERVESAGPSMAVEVLGLSTVPVAGDSFKTVGSLDEARHLAEQRADELRVERLVQKEGEGRVTLASVASAVASASANQDSGLGGLEYHSINLVLKVDVQGSLEAIRAALDGLPQDTVRLRVLLQAPGEINSSDIDLAVASEAIILGFNVPCSPAVSTLADDKGVEIRSYRVIYDLVDDMRSAMEGMLHAKEERISIGEAVVKAVFGTGSSKVAGCLVTEGKLVKGCSIVVRRGKKEVFSGSLSSLRRVKELAKEVAAGLECGVGVGNFDDWSEGDVIEAFNLVEKTRTLEEASQKSTEVLSTAL